MGQEAEAEAFGKGGHLGHGDHLASGSPQDDDVGIVNHRALGDALKLTPGLGQKDLAMEALEGRVTLKEQHVRVGEHGRGGLHFLFLSSDDRFMR